MKNPRNAGRKPKHGVQTEHLRVRVPQTVNDRLNAEAVRRGVTRSDVVVQTLDQSLPGGAAADAADAFE